jgi:hypothetical protein
LKHFVLLLAKDKTKIDLVQKSIKAKWAGAELDHKNPNGE